MTYINTNKLKKLHSAKASCQNYQGIIGLFRLIHRPSSNKQDTTEGDDKQIGNNCFAIIIKVEQNKIYAGT